MDEIQRILNDMQSPVLGIRKMALDNAIALLQDTALRNAARGIIMARAQDDIDTDLRQRAKQALQADAARSGVVSSNERQHMFRAACLKGHVNHYDKRVVCAQANTLVRSSGLSALLLICRTCGESFEVDAPCEGYV